MVQMYLIHPLQHMCTDLSMYLSKVDLYEKTGKLALEQAEELRQAGLALKDELACSWSNDSWILIIPSSPYSLTLEFRLSTNPLVQSQ